MTFPCTQCGACCRRAPLVWPGWPARMDGACAHLTEDNRCAIYKMRPAICRVVDDFAGNAKACNQMQQQDGLGQQFRLKET